MPIATSQRLKTQPLPAEFDVLFLEHYEFVHRTAYRVTGNFADAEDVVQTLFMASWFPNRVPGSLDNAIPPMNSRHYSRVRAWEYVRSR